MMADSTPRYTDTEVDRPDENVEKTTTTNVNQGGGPVVEEDDDEGPTSSVGNIIPMDKLKNGWFALSSFVTAQACTAREKAIQLNNSEAVQNMKKRTTETIGTAVEVVTPYWEKTKEVTTPYVEKTRENAAILSENMKPRVEAFSKTVSEAAVTAAEYTTVFVQKVSGKPSGDGGYSPSGGVNTTV